MNQQCSHLLSPYVIGKAVFKNRIEATTSEPHYLNGPETYPNDAVLMHYRDKAKGASIVSVTGLGEMGDTKKYPPFIPMTQFPDYDVFDLRNNNMFTRLTDVIHFYQSKACGVLDFLYGERHLTVNGKKIDIPIHEDMNEYTQEELDNIVTYMVEQAKACQRVGFDMVSVHCAYGRTLLAKLISGNSNHRSDDYGGSAVKRAKILKDVCKGIKEACGADMLIQVLISSHEDGEDGNTLDDTIAILKEVEDYVDIVEVRGSNADLSHPTGFDEETPSLEEAAAIKASGVQMAVLCVGGFFKPETCEAAIASGKVDFIGMARAWICNPDYGELLYEGKLDEIVPCIRCNKCHTFQLATPFRSACSVNPMVSLERYEDILPFQHYEKKKIAIVGGGPAGMKAAIVAADRGHAVTIYEAGSRLGGQLIHSDYAPFKWPLRDFKNYLIRQVEKRSNIEVKLDTRVTSAKLKEQGYDVVMAAIGSEPIVPPVEGIRDYGRSAMEIWGHEENLGHTIALIGGGEIGLETAMYLAGLGHHVVVLEMRDKLAADANPIHYRANLDLAWNNTKDAEGIVNAKVTRVEEGLVEYEDTKTQEKKQIKVNSILYSSGMRAKKDEALTFANAAPGFALLGDVADPVNNLLFSMQSAVAAASRF